MNSNLSAGDVVRSFFDAFGQGRLDDLVALFDPKAELHAVRSGTPATGEPYGTYRGSAGVRAFITALGTSFDTKEFAVDSIIGENEVAFASGRFVHEVKSTRRRFASEWALRCVVRGGRIVEYRFYEDSQAYARAAS